MQVTDNDSEVIGSCLRVAVDKATMEDGRKMAMFTGNLGYVAVW